MKMEDIQKRRTAFRQAAATLPLRIQQDVLALSDKIQSQCEELRLRAGRGVSYVIAGQETCLPLSAVATADLEETLGRATRYSVHSFAESLQNGFVTLEGGHRLGLCGAAILRGERIDGIRNLSSINLRIACEHLGAAAALTPHLQKNGRAQSMLILSPPAWGKTTLLRDCVRALSCTGMRVGVADERCELSGSLGGAPQFDLGPTTDIISGGSKSEAALLLLKTMSPAVLALDEITSLRDIEAVSCAAHCGTAVLATAHAYDREDFARRPLYHALLEAGVFDIFTTIRLENDRREYTMTTVGGEAIC